ncbi:MAG TPA: AMP-binding protein [Acidimicrobiia bacterium]
MSADLLDEYGVAAHARIRGHKIALASAEGTITYAELDRSIWEAARALRELGVGPERRLGLALRNRPEWMIAAMAAARIGAQCVPIPSGATADEREYFCTDGEVAYLLEEANLDDFADAAAKQSTDPLDDPFPDYVRLRAYTSGTTGHPKAVLRPPADPVPAMEGLIRYYGAYGIGGVDEINITASPIHHLAGFSGPHSALLLGHTTFILDHFDAREWLATVDRERVTYTWCAPVHLYRLMQVPAAERARYDVSSIKRVLHGSAPCAPTLKREVMEFFPEGAVWETYGGTETMGTVISAEEWLAKPGSVGRAAPGSTIKIYDDDGVELAPGEVGLVYIGSDWGRGFRYAGPEELTTAVYRGNLATLGDLGYLDEDGYLFIVDRRKDMVITGGANVYPAEVEAVLMDHPGIAEVAVLGMPDEEYGERVTAVVVAGRPVTADDVMAFAREHLVAYKSPRRVEFVDSLPRDPMGKVRKRELRDQLA